MYENMKKYTLSCLSAGHRPGMNVFFFVCDSCCHENDIKRLNEPLSVTQFSLVQNYTLNSKIQWGTNALLLAWRSKWNFQTAPWGKSQKALLNFVNMGKTCFPLIKWNFFCPSLNRYSYNMTSHSYIITFFITCFILPLGVIFFCYGKLLRKLQKVSMSSFRSFVLTKTWR